MKAAAAPAQNNGSKERRECYYCKKKGHLKKDCRKLKKDQETEKANEEGERERSSSKASMAYIPEDVDTALKASNGNASSIWFIDSGASNHVTSEKRLFSTYTAMTGRQLETAGGQRLPIVGKGDLEVPGTNGLMLTGV
jgi:hypothetical protein